MRWLFGVLAVIACGGSHGARSDAQVDGSRADAHGDATPDATADAALAPQGDARFWASD